MHSIARRIGRSPSTVSREIGRNGGRERYRAARAEQCAWSRAKRPQSCKLRHKPVLAELVADKLQQHWAPQQISGWLKREFPDDRDMNVSHETIYRTLFVQTRGALRKELTAYLRKRTVMRRSKNAENPNVRFHLRDAVSISQRPPEAEDRAVPGHWEGDLLFGGLHSFIATLVERRSRYVMLVKVQGKDSESVVSALTQHVRKLPQGLMRTLTWDRGSEMAQHRKFSIATDVQVYFCDPASPWQRGSNENTNGLLRQYFPKGMDLTDVSQAHLNMVAKQLNGRPRMTLGYATPAEVLSQTVASTG
jgi:IS30 family transposase